MHYRILAVLASAVLFWVGIFWATAQNGVEISDAACSPALQSLWSAASSACVGKPAGYICNGGGAPQAEPAGPVSNALAPTGALVDAQVVDALFSPPLAPDSASGGLVWLRLNEPAYTALLVGDVRMRDVTPPDFPSWQSILVETGADVPTCGAAPNNALIVQTPLDPETRAVRTSGIVINGASLVFSGTVLVQTREGETLFVNLGGRSRVLARGQEQPLLTGQQIRVPYAAGDFSVPAGPPSPALPLDVTQAANQPVGLLDRPLYLPQPGYVTTAGQVNMRAAPNTNAALILQIPAGEIMSVLGRNPAGDWLHVQLANGLTGWMFADLLVQNTGSIQAVYEATPPPPQRYGTLGTTARVVAPAGLNLRQAPDVQFDRILTLPLGTQVNLLARSPYSPWVKVENGGVTGWAALIALETQAIIESLPIDYNVPPPPPPTRIPGSFGNAFPDPRDNN